ncbi:phosphoglycerate kinase [Variibacter gotjawalensis]|uniref:Phosphoglycerate kinase n=1 Tax=Variibacter gotjawalensis TaxID=1333996 RepID=A0A0S3PVU4_9BRAD|nr:phosphoglycerate kinase [Variibacter gotjawalensis]NIK45876.1 phosphoglycerate kinase [Variibacter gotjawalensis]RZS47799.1 phosphoglycerate kinase [Variibacter gotjawalensis]BAT60053.1 phosphoglycerate kinase [Variibacter gotjawalensis]
MAGKFRTLDDADVKGKRVLIRVDLNVPMENGKVTDATRLDRIAPGIAELSGKGAKVILLAHFGRPKGRDDKNSLKPVAAALGEVLRREVKFADDCIGETAEKAVGALKDGDVLCLENTRFYTEEEKNDPAFVEKLAKLGDLYVNDAFSAAHRAHASTEGLAHKLPAYAGRTMQAELEALDAALGQPQRPVAAIVGGAKVSTKLDLLGNLIEKVDALIIGGGMANTFLAAQGINVGKSLCEHDLADTAREIIAKAKAKGCEIVLPVDGVMAKEFKAETPTRASSVKEIEADEMMLDIGALSGADVISHLSKMKTLVWNGPFGAFEIQPFDTGTVMVAHAAAELTKSGKLVTVAGGGDTVAALNHAHVADDFTYISTAGGAFLEWMEGKPLPGVEALRK